MAARTKVFVDIVTKTDGKEPGSGLKKFAIGAGIAAVAVAGLIKVGKELVNVYAVQEQAEARLEATIKSTGKAANLTKDQLTDMATGLQGVTKFGDEAIIGAEALLLTFKNIGEDTFPRALESILDVSEAMGTGLKESSIQVGKALNDPVLGITALTRVGITFTQKQKDMIKSLVATGDKAGAQGVILEELESQFGGVARAAADTATGAMVQMANAIGDVKEEYGQLIAQGLQPFTEAITKQVTALASYLGSLNEASEILKLINDGAIESGRSLEDLENILADLITKRDISRGQVQQSVLDEISLIEILIDTYGMKDVFLTKAADHVQILIDAEATASEKAAAIRDAEEDGLKKLEELRVESLTQEERKIELLDKEIILWAALRSEGADVQDLLNTLVAQRNDLLTDEVDILEGLTFDWESFNETVHDGLADQKEAIEELTLTWQDLAESGLGAFASTFKMIGEEGVTVWDTLKQAGKNAISAVLEGLAQEALVRAALAFAIPFGAGIPSAVAYGAAATAAFAASGLVQSFATGGQFITDGPTLIGDNASGQERVTVEPLGGGDSGGLSRETFRLVGPGNELLGWIQRVGIDNGGLHPSGKRNRI